MIRLATMRRGAAFAFGAVSLVVATSVAGAADFKSIGNDPAILYDAPTLRATRVFVAPRGMPLEVIVAQGDWLRVRDANGGFSWVEKKAVVDRRTVVAKGAPGSAIDVRSAPDANAPVVYRVGATVLLDVTAVPVGGWVAVRHRDGQTGFVKTSDVWGT